MKTKSLPFFSVVIPVLNEERHIGTVLASLIVQLQDMDAEILVMDGGSSDATRAIVADVAATNAMVRWIDNPGRTQSAACNLAAETLAPQSRILLRVDAHAAYPRDFVFQVIDALRTTGATSVVVPMRTVGIGAQQRAIAAAQNSRLGNGGSSHRRIGESRFVDHGHHAAFDLDFFRSVGGYDRNFTHNEDGEFDVRGLRAGGRVWLCSEAVIDYFPRESLSALRRQYVRHGRGRARTTRKHGLRLKARQALPLLLLPVTAIGLLTPVVPWVGIPGGIYLCSSFLWGTVAAIKQRDPALLLMGPAAVVMHLSWAIGFLDGWLRARPGRPMPAQRALDDTQQAEANR
ncbi:glycosyltransferase family 2 protein [Lichenicola cladoniae]|uniref:Glycosyltransferase family 2 protein n=1 Tax=Lichenicola cladoniae TaxID=1484109 RepID=A0A6M8H7Q9_9PROT|nr:glycosyltransferase family 2 protein [Lichenicola cladoniae]NPD65148.1 glycosyltransferase family 2 protein [Acetobacteraceae bacterium]QKE88753.1 glycosyltransferase family 2 protein [Lichenicola cladoniae]